MAEIERIHEDPGGKSDVMRIATCTGPVNIAVIKYWGKRDDELILPINASLSVTLNQEELKTTTTVAASPVFQKDRIWLNDREESIENPRLQKVLKEIRRRTRKRSHEDDEVFAKMAQWHVHICSRNNFPTAAGLASSAAGYACLVFTLAKLFGIDDDVSDIARQGSGSACRSMFGGFVEWTRGSKVNGSDSIAVQLFPESHWPDLRILILVVSDQKKITGSTSGMQRSVETSDLIKYRADHCVPERMARIKQAIAEKDFETFAEITMKESNQFHAMCLDTFPPIFYMNDISKAIVRLTHCYNTYAGGNKVAYTFDAGPNACIYTLDEHVQPFLALINHFFPPQNDEKFTAGGGDCREVVEAICNHTNLQCQPGAIKYIKQTNAGPGPLVMKQGPHLLNNEGMPARDSM